MPSERKPAVFAVFSQNKAHGFDTSAIIIQQYSTKMTISIIGIGNMGGAIARGLCTSTLVAPEDIRVSDPNRSQLDTMRQFNPAIHTCSDNKVAVAGADIVLLAVKPWLVEAVAEEIADTLDSQHQILISIAAGVELHRLQMLFGFKQALFRIIPNTAIDVQQSVNTISSLNATPEQEQLVCNIFNKLGRSYLVPEKQLDALMALSSCGIAYAFRYIRAAMEGGVEMGIYPNMAKEIVLQTLRGAVELLEHTGNHPEAEIDKVTTPGGITIKGLNEMEAAGFTTAIIKGLRASLIKH